MIIGDGVITSLEPERTAMGFNTGPSPEVRGERGSVDRGRDFADSEWREVITSPALTEAISQVVLSQPIH
jgi:hypothetical protein